MKPTQLKTNNKKCYIAGKIGDLPELVYHGNFNKGKEDVLALGLQPTSPCDIHGHCLHSTWLEYMRCDLKELLSCDNVYALNNWQDSPGATIEVNLAVSLGLNVIYQP